VFSYDEGDGEFALKDVDFIVRKGSLTALVGTSDSGTTVTNLLLRLWDIQSGIIKIGGTDICEMDYDTLLDNISIVMQNVHLTSGGILENIRISRKDAAREEVIEAARKAQIHDFIAGLPQGYDTLVRENGVGLRLKAASIHRAGVSQRRADCRTGRNHRQCRSGKRNKADGQRIGAKPHRAGHRPSFAHDTRRRRNSCF
jgi:ABC-type transport system involved in Fe-S cluster assembly fused permease/ATPase subunit